MKKYILNDRIRAKEVRCIDENRKQLGVLAIEEALRIAQERDLDLLLLSEDASPPVCRLVNFGQFKYEQQKKDKQAKKGNKGHIIKELKMSPKISSNDYSVRLNAARKFLEKGFKVKLTIFFKGREMTHPELGVVLVNRFLGEISEWGTAESDVAQAAKSLVVSIVPSKVKTK